MATRASGVRADVGRPIRAALAVLVAGAALTVTAGFDAHAQDAPAPVMRDLEGKNPKVLSPDEVKALLPGAKVQRTSARGNTVFWTNDSGGTLFATSDNRSYGSVSSTTTRGTWNLTDDGRYCVLIEYRRTEPEQWCRFIVKTDDGYYGTTSATSPTSRVFKLEITK